MNLTFPAESINCLNGKFIALGWFVKKSMMSKPYNDEFEWMAKPGTFSMGLKDYGFYHTVDMVDARDEFINPSSPIESMWSLLAMAVVGDYKFYSFEDS